MDTQILNKVEMFFSQFKHQLYKKGELLIRADDNPSGVFYLKEGTVKQYIISKKGDEIVINVFKSNAFFPMSWAINETPNIYFYEALSNLEIYRAPREESIKFIKENPDVLFNLISRVYKGVEGILTRMTYLMSGDAYSRLITELLIYAKRFGKGQESIMIEISEKDLAAQSGMTRETVSREMKSLKDKNLIVSDEHHFMIKDIKKLELELIDGV
jgi:CRP-like cAMP-binding protein